MLDLWLATHNYIHACTSSKYAAGLRTLRYMYNTLRYIHIYSDYAYRIIHVGVKSRTAQQLRVDIKPI